MSTSRSASRSPMEVSTPQLFLQRLIALRIVSSLKEDPAFKSKPEIPLNRGRKARSKRSCLETSRHRRRLWELKSEHALIKTVPTCSFVPEPIPLAKKSQKRLVTLGSSSAIVAMPKPRLRYGGKRLLLDC